MPSVLKYIAVHTIKLSYLLDFPNIQKIMPLHAPSILSTKIDRFLTIYYILKVILHKEINLTTSVTKTRENCHYVHCFKKLNDIG